MALKVGQCNCGRGLANVTYTMYSVTGSQFCARCVEDYERIQREEAHDNGPYGYKALAANIDRLSAELASALEAWYSRDRENPQSWYTLANRIRTISQSLSAYTADLAGENWKAHNRAR